MITTPADVAEDPNWNGTSVDYNTKDTVQNLDSGMSLAEHQRIVVAARRFLTTYKSANVTWPDVVGKDEAKDAFENLKNCYEDSNSEFTLKISKGIHQPKYDPHIQLTLSHTANVVEDVKFHLDVSGTEIAENLSTLPSKPFHWEPHRFSGVFSKMTFSWPENAGAPNRKEPQFKGATRRNSVSYAGLDIARIAHQNALVKAAFDEKKSKVLGPALGKFSTAMKSKGGFPFVNSKNKEILYEKGRVTIDNRTVVWNDAKKEYYEEKV